SHQVAGEPTLNVVTVVCPGDVPLGGENVVCAAHTPLTVRSVFQGQPVILQTASVRWSGSHSHLCSLSHSRCNTIWQV
uniref:Uncharacterized protein n=1 Tax=Mola mola TaxID=94237 RepID=A0A3Q3WPN4_MOLML